MANDRFELATNYYLMVAVSECPLIIAIVAVYFERKALSHASRNDFSSDYYSFTMTTFNNFSFEIDKVANFFGSGYRK